MNRVTKIVLRGEVGDLIGKLTATSAAVKSTVGSMTDASKEAHKFRAGLSSVGDTAGKVGLVAAAGLGAIVVATANFDKQMSAVQAATHESAASMELLRAAAIKAGADTAFSASEAGQGIEELAKAGVATKDILGGGLTGALDLAAAGALGVGDAAEIAATAMTQFSLGGDKVGHIADLLAAAAGKAQGSVADMGMALKQSGLVASQTGLTIEETTGTLAAFASAGLVGSDAGTSFKTMLQSLTPTGTKAANEMDRLGITAYDAQGNFVGMTKFADSLKTGLQDLSVEQQNAAMKTIFGSDAVRAAAVVFQQGGDGIQKWIDKTNDSGYAAATAATRLDNLAGDMEAFKGSLETALIGSGEGATGPLRSLVAGATDLVNAFNDLPPAAKSVTTGLLGIVAVTGGAAFFGAKVIGGIASTRVALETLGVTAAQTKTALVGIASVTATLAAAGVAASKIDEAGDANRTTRELGDSLNALADGRVDKGLKDLSFSAGSFGDALKQAAFNDIHWNDAADEVKDLDTALSQMDAAKAETAFATIRKEGLAAGLSVKDLANIFPEYTKVADDAEVSTGNLPAGFDSAGNAVDSFGDAVEGAKNEVDTLKDSLDGLLDPLLNQEDASNAWKDSIASLTADLKKNGNTLDDATSKGRANQDAIRDRVKALKDSVKADADAGAGTDQLRSKMLRGARGILAAGEAAGISRGKMRSYLKTLGLTPAQIKTVISADTNDAHNKVRSLQRFIDGMHGKTVKVKVEGGTPGGLTVGSANGNILDYYADGGFSGGPENHVAQIAPAGAMRVWAEPETGGEAYIPFAANKRKRSQQIAMQTVDRLGGVAYFANGGIVGGGSGSTVTHARLLDPTVRVEKNGLLTLVNAAVEIGIAGSDNYNAGRTRAKGGN